MTVSGRFDRAPIVFTDFASDIAERFEIHAELDEIVRATTDWADVRRFCMRNGIAFEELP